MIVDADIHPLMDPASVEARLAEPWRTRFASGSRGAGGFGFWNPNGVRRIDAVLPDGTDISTSAAAVVAELLEPNSIDYGILNVDHLQFALSPEPDYSTAVAHAINDVLSEEWLPVSPRLRASIVVSPREPAGAAAEIRARAGHPGFVQVLMPSAAPLPYGHRIYHPIYEAAADAGLPVATHPGLEGAGVAGHGGAAGPPGSYLEHHTGLVQTAIAHLISLVCEGVFERFPDLRFVVLESGVSSLPGILWRFDKNWMGLRSTVPWLTEPPSAIIARHVLLGAQPIEEPPRHLEQLHQILEMFDSSNMLMFATDFPHWDGDLPDFSGRAFPKHLRAAALWPQWR